MIIEAIFAQVFNKVLSEVLKPNVPVMKGDAESVAKSVTEAIAPIVVNATNSEPWYKSRIYLGLIAAGLGLLLSRFGVTVTGGDLEQIISTIGSLLEAAGVLYATYGRIVGASKKPLGS